MPTKNHTNTAAAYKGVPSSLGTWGSQRVTSVHTARAQKRDLEGENTVLRLQQSPQHAWGGEHRNPAYWPASLYQPSLVPQKRKGEHEMKAVPFPDSHKFNFPRTRLMHYLHTIPLAHSGHIQCIQHHHNSFSWAAHAVKVLPNAGWTI